MAGTNANFNAAKFREAITMAMEMGTPNDSDKVLFCWTPSDDYDNADSGGKPWDWTSSNSSDTPEPIHVPAALEFSARPAASQDSTIGQFDTSRMIVTLLDTHHKELLDHGNGRMPDMMRFNNTDYTIQFWAPAVGLFDAGIIQGFSEALDES